MQSTVSEIAPNIYRISTFHAEFGIQFNQFLIKDDEPFLMHTGMRKMFAMTPAVASVIEPASLRWIGFSHFESDECGALNEWLKAAPDAQAVCSVVGALVMINDFAERPARALADGEVLGTGRHRLQFLSTPHVPHGWDAGLFFEQSDRTLFVRFVLHPGDPEPLTAADVLGARIDRAKSLRTLGQRHALHAVHGRHAAPARRVETTNSRIDARL
jgi:flavorubredoxin